MISVGAWKAAKIPAVTAVVLVSKACHCRSSLLHILKSGQQVCKASSSHSMQYLQKPGKLPSLLHAACLTGQGAMGLSSSSSTGLSGSVVPAQIRRSRARLLWEMQMESHTWQGVGGQHLAFLSRSLLETTQACQPARRRPVLDAPHPARQQVLLHWFHPHQLVGCHGVDAGLQRW